MDGQEIFLILLDAGDFPFLQTEKKIKDMVDISKQNTYNNITISYIGSIKTIARLMK